MNCDQIKNVIRQLEAIETHFLTSLNAINDAIALQTRLAECFLKATQTPFEPISNAALHLRHHRPGRPSKIDNDLELRAFIMARIDTTTFPALERAFSEHFPPERRVGKSTIHKWWQRRVKSIPKSHPE